MAQWAQLAAVRSRWNPGGSRRGDPRCWSCPPCRERHSELVRWWKITVEISRRFNISQHSCPPKRIEHINPCWVHWYTDLVSDDNLSFGDSDKYTVDQCRSYIGQSFTVSIPGHGLRHDEPLLRVLDSCFTSIWRLGHRQDVNLQTVVPHN